MSPLASIRGLVPFQLSSPLLTVRLKKLVFYDTSFLVLSLISPNLASKTVIISSKISDLGLWVFLLLFSSHLAWAVQLVLVCLVSSPWFFGSGLLGIFGRLRIGCANEDLQMWVSGMNLITAVIGFGMSATFIVFICTRIICGRLRRLEARPMFEIESRVELEQRERRVIGLEPVVVAAIPTMNFNREAFSSMEDTQCSICLAEYQEKEVLRIMPKCGHTFHLSCIDVWLRRKSTCPVCRLPLQDSSGTKHGRASMISITRSFDDSEDSMNRSHQLLLPGPEHSAGSVGTQGPVDSVLVNIPEPTLPAEAERRQ